MACNLVAYVSIWSKDITGGAICTLLIYRKKEKKKEEEEEILSFLRPVVLPVVFALVNFRPFSSLPSLPVFYRFPTLIYIYIHSLTTPYNPVPRE